MLHLPFKKLNSWQQQAFAAALIQRMLPNYQLFSENTNFGDSTLLTQQLQLIWQKLAQQQKLNAEAQLQKLESQIPNAEEFDFFGVYPAIDAAVALSLMFEAMLDNSIDIASEVSQLSINSVKLYIELQSEVALERWQMKKHPLMEWELATQNELFDFLKTAKASKATIEQIKAMVMESGLSSLGIEIN